MTGKQPKILMIYPAGGKYGVLADHPLFDFMGQYSYMPPLGLMTVGGHLPRTWDVRLIDANIHEVKDEDIDWADYVMLSGLYTHKVSLCDLAERSSKRGKHVILGGPVATTSAEWMRGRHGIKTICLNEGEIYIGELIKDIEAGTVKASYGEADGRADMTDCVVPRFDLLPDLHKYTLQAMQVSRGCPFDCEFCDVPMLAGRKMRYKTPEQIKAELDALHKQVKRGDVFICDDNLTGQPTRCKAALEAMAEWSEANGYPFKFATQLSLNVADKPELLELLYRANVRLLTVGIESPNLESLAEVHKVQNLKGSIKDRVETIIKAGLEVYAFLVVGFDNDGPSIFDEQYALVQSAKIPVADVNILTALDHTPLGARMRKENRVLVDTTSNTELVLSNLAVAMTNFKTKLDPRVLQDGYARLLENLYDPKNSYRRTREMVELLPEKDRYHHSVALRWEVETLFLVIFSTLFFPSRLRQIGHALKLFFKFRQPWRVFRFYLAIFTVGVTYREFLRRAERIREYMRTHETTDPTAGYRAADAVIPGATTGARGAAPTGARLPVVQ